MRAVNLLPKDDGRQRGASVRENPLVIGGVVGFVLVTAILAAMFLTASTSVSDNQTRHDAVEAELAATPVPPPTVPGTSQLSQEKNARISALSAALSGRLAWDRVLREVSLVLPGRCLAHEPLGEAPVADLRLPPPASPSTATRIRTTASRACSRACPSCRISRMSAPAQLRSRPATTGRKVVEFSINATVKSAGSA